MFENLPITAGNGCSISIANKVLHKSIINKYNKYKKQYEKDPQHIQSSHNLYRKSLQDIIVDKKEYESLCNIFAKYVAETKNECFLMEMNIKMKLTFFSHKNLKLNLEVKKLFVPYINISTIL